MVFTGSVTPAVHAFDRVLLQRQVNGTDDWRTVKVARLDRNSNYAIPYRFRVPRSADCLICRAPAAVTPPSPEELDAALDQALARLGHE